MNKNYFAFFGILVSIFLGIGFLGINNHNETNSNQEKQLVISHSYRNVDFSELENLSPIILKGEIIDEGQSKKVNWANKPDEEEWEIFTDKIFRVDKVYKSDEANIQAGDEVKIRLSGGKIDNYSQNFEIILSKNDKYIIFLTLSKMYPGNNEVAYSIINGNNGVFKLKNNILENPKFNNVNSLDIFEGKLKNNFF